ncbi:uncharacterized protein ACBT57_005851 isoform 1-T1 [Dama dama]|uniref:junctophilin-2-like isoform X1 n=1 Tax=Dama dama TaxID=30532 RepID=UPI002A372219|nr:junctophilin-2-like isoform X1 [Dama dama]
MRCILGVGARPANREIPRARALPPEPSRPPTSTQGRGVTGAGGRGLWAGEGCGRSPGTGCLPARPFARRRPRGRLWPCPVLCERVPPRQGGLRPARARAPVRGRRGIGPRSGPAPARPTSGRSRRAGLARAQCPASPPEPESALSALAPALNCWRPGSVLSDTCVPATSFHLLVPVCFLGYTESQFRFST